jgi:HK97 family phage major capsid protein
MNEDIKEIVENGLNGFKSKLNEFEEEITSIKTDLISFGQNNAEGYSASHGSPVNFISKLTASNELKEFASNRGLKSVSIGFNTPLPKLLVKSVVGDTTGAGNNLLSVQGHRDPRLGENPQRRLTVFDVLPRLPVTSNSFEFNILDSYVNAAAYQTSEGATKSEGSMPTDLVTAPICTVAHWIKASEQVLADVPALSSQIDSLMRYGVLAKASAEIINGATSGKIQGLVTQATAYPYLGTTPLADAIGSAITYLDTIGWEASLVIIHPSDWFDIQSERSTTEKEYVAGGWSVPNPRTIWGVQVITDPSVSPGNPLILDASQVAILDRLDARVEFGRSGTDMVENKITVLAELRAGLAVFSPSAVLVLSAETD